MIELLSNGAQIPSLDRQNKTALHIIVDVVKQEYLTLLMVTQLINFLAAQVVGLPF